MTTTQADTLLDYPMIDVPDVQPIFVKHMLVGAMTLRFMRQVPGLGHDAAADAARATWDTEWETDPAPRDFDVAVQAVDSELEHWEGE